MSDLGLDSISTSTYKIEPDQVFGKAAKDLNKNLESVSQEKSFAQILKDSSEKVNLYQEQANIAIKELVAGRNKNIHETMLTIERADTSLKLMMQVRNKILEAYKEIMRMQV